MNHINLEELNAYVQASNNVINLMKNLYAALPKGEKHSAVEKQFENAEKALKASEAQLAKSFGYHLCQCTFPPQIMLQIGRHPTWEEMIFQCPKCENQSPTAGYFRGRDEAKQAADSEAKSWNARRI